MNFEIKECLLAEVADLIRGVSYKPKDLVSANTDQSIPLLRATNIGTNELDLTDVLYIPAKLVKNSQQLIKFDVVIAMSSGSRKAVGRLAQLRQDWGGTFGAFCGVIRPKVEKVDPVYLGYVLHSPEFRARIDTFAAGTAIMNLTKDGLLNFQFRLPPLKFQKQVAQILGGLDDRINLLREINSTLDEITKAIFKSWFVNFEPVLAKQEGKQPIGIDDATAALFPDSFEQSELGNIPKGWSCKKLGDVCSYLSRGISPKYLEEGGVLVINQKCIRNFSIDYSKARRHNPEQRSIAGRELIIGDILVNSTGVGTLGRVAQVLSLPEVSIVDSHVTVLRAKDELKWTYLGQCIDLLQPTIESLGEGSTGQTELSRSRLADLKILIPDQNILNAFDQITLVLKERIAINEAQINVLSNTRDVLLPRLISGQLIISDAQEQIEVASALSL